MSVLDTVLDVLAGGCLLGGSFLALAAGMGLARFPDLLARMHTATKPQVLGVLLMMFGLGLRLRSGHVIWMLVLVALLQMATSPVAAHMVARAGYRTGKVDSGSLVVDELTRDVAAAQRAARESPPSTAGVADGPDADPPEDELSRGGLS